jgi:methylated-DNA-[protein]-cysteine S-methyltransferase
MNKIVINFFENIFLEIFWNNKNQKIKKIDFKLDVYEEIMISLPNYVKLLITYFKNFYNGHPNNYSLDFLDFSNVTPFYRKVYFELYKIPIGKIITYKGLARLAGNEKASRAVGGAMKKNPFPLIIPCHRVLSSKHIGGFSSGIELKKRLLDKELNI